MKNDDLKKYCDTAVREGITGVRQIEPASVVTAGWVRWKCQYGCNGYNSSYCCPPHTPAPEETRRILDSYRRALLFHLEVPYAERKLRLKKYRPLLIDLEGEMFKDGYYKAFALLAGPCDLCKSCSINTGASCQHRSRIRPSMEACGIDVFATARNNGFQIETLREITETRHIFCLMLVD